MSHELRTPLNGILGYAQVLSRSEKLSEQGRKGLGIIESCGNHLLTLINDVLDLSKIEARRMELYPRDFHLPAFVQSVAEICRIRAEQKGVDFVYEVDKDLPLGVSADEKRLRQVLINLLGNAIKFTDRGQVSFRIQKLDSDVADTVRLRFEIQDTGVGMSPAQAEKICLPFEQAGDNVRKQEGTGLGLTISTEILALMNSQLQIESQPQVGSTFSFELALPEATEWQRVAQKTSQGRITGYKGEKRRILIVDDRWENCSVLLGLLSPLGFDVIEALDGAQGLEQAKLARPDLILTDLTMPVMDGFELLEHLLADEQLKDIPVVVSSASVFEADQHKCLEAGAVDFLPKPVQLDKLIALLKHHLDLEWTYAEVERSAESPDSASSSASDDAETARKLTDASEASFSHVPVEILESLNELALSGDLDGLITQARSLFPSYRALSSKLIEMAENFQINQIKQFLQEKIQAAV